MPCAVEVHPLAAVLPLPSPLEQNALTASIRAHGLLAPIVLLDGKILDGRGRYAGCQQGGVTPRFVDWTDLAAGGCTPLEWLLAENVARRQLSTSQRAALAVRLLPRLSVEAAQRQRRGRTLLQNPSKGRAGQHAARLFAVSASSVYEAQNIQRRDLRLFDRVVAGDITLGQAKQRLKLDAARAAAVHFNPDVPTGSYELIVVDPPWPEPGVPYTTISLPEIRKLSIPAADDAVVGLWVTQAHLAEGFEALRAWGFEYAKKTVTWWKRADEKLPVGRRTRRDTEFLLIGVRGSPPIDLHSLGDIVTEPGREHSRKPDESYRRLADSWPAARKLDMFSRERRNGWEQWGSQCDYFGEEESTRG
jgi:N6-adenosine-specific RNA methylase IME4